MLKLLDAAQQTCICSVYSEEQSAYSVCLLFYLCLQQEKQNEARYLREHRGELIEELAKTIVQKVKHIRKIILHVKASSNLQVLERS